MARNDGNNTLFFIVGGLLVLAVVFGLFLWTPGEEGPADVEPAAGGDTYIEGTVDTVPPAATEDMNETETVPDTGTTTDR